jgi:hypothetical protein
MAGPTNRSPRARVVLQAIGVAALAGGVLGLSALPSRPPETPSAVPVKKDLVVFGRDVRPILSDRCFTCHGFDPATRAAGLRLDTRDEAIAKQKSGDAAIVPGHPELSELVRRIVSEDPDVSMPPPSSGKKPLSAEERRILTAWIEQGAAYEPHWAFVPPAPKSAPEVRNAAWPRNDIDRFVLAELEARGIVPSVEADKASLARRVFLDVTGLPPTPEELDAFLADARPDAYEHLVDRLLTEEPYVTRYAERMASPWLDQARYADTSGIHMDAGRQMWLWRDWVIDAYRTNMPFDRFTIEQLAGDLIPDATVSQKIASGFNRNHVTTDEGGAIDEEYLVEYAVDRTATTGGVFMGLTLGCARCHDHKFDPVSMEDFYGLLAFFNSNEEPGLYSQIPDAQRALEPFIVVPTAEQTQRKADLTAERQLVAAAAEQRTPEEESLRQAFLAGVRENFTWANAKVIAASSTDGSTVAFDNEGLVSLSGQNPPVETVLATLSTDRRDLRTLMLEIPTSGPDNKLGRSPNGNVVVSGVEAFVRSVADPAQSRPITFTYAWANVSQTDGDFHVTTLVTPWGGPIPQDAGWALAAHQAPGGRVALLVASEPFGYEGGSTIEVKVHFRSQYTHHVARAVRLDVGFASDAGLAELPSAASTWRTVGPFAPNAGEDVFDMTRGPEAGLDPAATFGDKKLAWQSFPAFSDGKVIELPGGPNAFYIGRHLFATTPRSFEVALGSDDGFRLFVNGEQAAARRVDRGVAPDQDKATISLRPGINSIVLKIVNTGGPGGAYYRPMEDAPLTGVLAAAALPDRVLGAGLAADVDRAWRTRHLPAYRTAMQRLAAIDGELAALDAAAPKTMVMKELAKPRETFVLTRGQYDHPDKNRRVERSIPKAFGSLPADAPKNRLGLAQWIVSKENPLTARVTVNRLWELCFGTGIVRTSEDFGYQSEWPSHPELLDHLAARFADGWDVRAMMRLILTSATYRQDSTIRSDLRDIDPSNRLLASYPRRRLPAEAIRDQALYVAGLLVERAGGPSVKPYQPDGLWQEVAMPQSNTRVYVRGMGDDLHRRSLYTYWKRAAPPPTMLTFDAPTREACTIRRPTTNTPLQALALWNDEQFVEAARALAARTLSFNATDDERLAVLFRRCTARNPDVREAQALAQTLAHFRARFAQAPKDADGLLSRGVTPIPEGTDRAELAAWTMIASAVLNLHETLTLE